MIQTSAENRISIVFHFEDLDNTIIGRDVWGIRYETLGCGH